MKTIFALTLLAIGLAACQTYPADQYGPGQGSAGYEPAPYYPEPGDPSAEANYRAIGTEPFWNLTIGRDLIFTDRGTGASVSEPAPVVRRSASGDRFVGRRLSVIIDRRPCSDGMSERSYPDTVSVTVDGRPYRGCGANSAFFEQIGEDGTNRPGQGEHDLSNSNWRIVSIDGRQVPMSGFYFNFARDRVSGRLGCNNLNGGYSVTGTMLSTPALAMTRMACPEMQFEIQGARIMGQPTNLSGSGDRLTLSNRLGSIELIRAR